MSKWLIVGVVVAVVLMLGVVGAGIALVGMHNRTEPEEQARRGPNPAAPDVAPAPAKDATKSSVAGAGHTPPAEIYELALKRLHQEAVDRFLSRPENGMRRMITLPVKAKSEWKEPTWSPGELSIAARVDSLPDLLKIHEESVRDLTDPKKNQDAYAAARRNVRIENGVLLQDALMKSKDWEIKTLDLVGLVKNEHPTVYVSNQLPKMKELGKVPTRYVDFFEQAGLEHLQKGNEHFARSQDGTTRMLGAIRATSDCLKCHDGKEGALLGAFSYTLRVARYEDPRRLGQEQQQEAPKNALPPPEPKR